VDIERVVLLGYMCSGKSSVGQSLARRLDWEFIDYDVEIERRERRPVAEIVEAEGEAYFRSMENELTQLVAQSRHLVMAPGGGWITRPELLESIRPGTLSVWLQVSPMETVRRLREAPDSRPLKSHPDPTAIIAEMIEEREPLFRRGDLAIPTDGRGIEEVAFEIEQLVRFRMR
jgi:shikimate kinase